MIKVVKSENIMNKKIVSLVILASLFCVAYFASAQTVTIPNPLQADSFEKLLLTIAGGIGMLVAGLGTIMIIIAGIMFLLSAGSPEKIATAKKALFFAVLGILIGASATAIVEIIKEVLKVKI